MIPTIDTIINLLNEQITSLRTDYYETNMEYQKIKLRFTKGDMSDIVFSDYHLQFYEKLEKLREKEKELTAIKFLVYFTFYSEIEDKDKFNELTHYLIDTLQLRNVHYDEISSDTITISSISFNGLLTFKENFDNKPYSVTYIDGKELTHFESLKELQEFITYEKNKER